MATEQKETRGVPEFRDKKEMETYYEGKYGKDVTKALNSSVKDRQAALEALKKSGLNSKAEDVLKEYSLYRQEFDRHESLLHKGWRWTKEVVTAPFRFAWRTFKKHPVLTLLAAAALAAGGVVLAAYMAGNLEAVLGYVGINHLAAAGAAAEPGGAIVTGTLPELGGGAVGGASAGPMMGSY